jgi:hypothetical protein
MYEDDKLWPIKCTTCGEEFTKKVGWLKTHTEVKCPGNGCPNTITLGKEGFSHALAQAKQGLFDPYREMMRLTKNSSL